MRYGKVRRRARDRVRRFDHDVGIPRPLDVDVLLDRLELYRGRPIELHETSLAANGPCGLWIRERDRDIIVYSADTTAQHQDHIILHEVGHMIAEHGVECGLSVERAIRLVSHVHPMLIQHMLARSVCHSVEEQEAEMIACLIRIASSERPAPDTSASPYRSRIDDIFGT